MLTYDEIVEKNTELGFEFSLYVMEHPEFAARIPKGARVILLPKNDPELSRANREAAERSKELDDEPDRPVVYIEFERLAPIRSRLVRPRLAAPQPA